MSTVLLLTAASVFADTYEAWKARVFSATEQSDPAVSDPGVNPSGDGINNLLKYALSLDPHQSGTGGLPQVFNGGDYLYFTFRVPADMPTDVHIFPEISPDLVLWHRGPNAVRYFYSSSDVDGTRLDTYYALSLITDNSRLFMRLTTLLGTVLPVDWQVQNFGETGIDANAAPDGDGLTNFQEYLLDSDPNDIYSPTPLLTIISGNQQGGPVNQFLPQPLVVRVSNIHGQPILNAPVHFLVVSGGGQIGADAFGQNLSAELDRQTNASGQTQVYYEQGSSAPIISSITAQATHNGHASGPQTFTASTASPPVITLISPQAGSTSSTSQVTVTVQVSSDAPLDEVRINSILVSPSDDAGNYTQTLTLGRGAQFISVRAQSIYGMVTLQQFPISVDLPPNLTLLTPADNQTFAEANVFVKVQADTNDAVTVTINGKTATRRGNTYAVWVPLTIGSNALTATLTDSAGRQSSDSVTVQFTPPAGWNPNADDDGDGVPNYMDLYPYDKNNSADNDNDGVGNNDDPNPDDPNVDGPVTITNPVDGEVIDAQ